MATDRIDQLRAFNRFWTARIGVLDAHLLETPYTLTEARVLYELAHRRRAEPHQLRRELGLDAGYLSRILQRFRRDRLLVIAPSPTDRRTQIVTLTARGRRGFATLDRRSRAEMAALLASCPPPAQDAAVAAMAAIQRVFAPAPVAPPVIALRPPGPGDLGWIVQRHGALYAAEYGWDHRFEALVARIVADFAAGHDPAREAAWIATLDGAPAGSILCVTRSRRVAQLRLLLVEPTARGHGIGALLVATCVEFARRRGYHQLTLWTNDVLHAARHLYERAGFRLVSQARHASFGKRSLRAQTWTLDLRAARAPAPAASPASRSAHRPPASPPAPAAPPRRSTA